MKTAFYGTTSGIRGTTEEDEAGKTSNTEENITLEEMENQIRRLKKKKSGRGRRNKK